MSRVGDTGENTRVENTSGAFFLKLFLKTLRKRILLKARKRIEVSGHADFEHILLLSFLRYLNLKLFQSCFQSRFRTL